MRYPYNILPYPNLQQSQRFESTVTEEQTYAQNYLRNPRYTDTDRKLSITLRLSREQFAVWISFVLRDLDRGINWFTADVIDERGNFRLSRLRLVEGKFSANIIGPDSVDVSAEVDVERVPFLNTYAGTFLDWSSTTQLLDSLQ